MGRGSPGEDEKERARKGKGSQDSMGLLREWRMHTHTQRRRRGRRGESQQHHALCAEGESAALFGLLGQRLWCHLWLGESWGGLAS